MTAFVGIISFDGQPVAPGLITELTAYLARIGPDGQCATTTGTTAFGAAWLNTGGAESGNHGLLEFDGGSVIIGDIRLDARGELINKLDPNPNSGLAGLPDIELLLRAWRRWGQDLTSHIIGDFSFAIWDHNRKSLFTARDHMGVRTFYYHLKKERLVFSNALNAVLQVPGLDRTLNPQLIADFLLFQMNTEFTTTSFKHIQQLAPGSEARFQAGSQVARKFWSIPVEPPLHFNSDQETVEQFDDIFTQAVADRLRCSSTNILVSAGMDSTSITVKANAHFTRQGRLDAIHLTTARAIRDMDESEHPLVTRLAKDLGLNLRFIDPVIEDYFDQKGTVAWPSPDLCWHQAQRITADYYASLAATAPVALSGQGGDPLLKKNYSYMPGLARKGKWITWAGEFIAYRRMHGHRPPLGIQTAIRRKFQTPDPVSVPNWINPDFAREQHMLDRLRLKAASRQMMQSNQHPHRPEAWHLLSSPYWQFVLPGHDAQVTGQPLEFRHPFLDIRLIRFLMRLSSPRWFHQKSILRQAMATELPAYITERPKHVFSKNTLKPALLALNDADWEKISSRVRDIHEFVDWKVYARLSGQLKSLTAGELELLMAPVYLADWTGQIT